jgi:hypothetical protein
MVCLNVHILDLAISSSFVSAVGEGSERRTRSRSPGSLPHAGASRDILISINQPFSSFFLNSQV